MLGFSSATSLCHLSSKRLARKPTACAHLWLPIWRPCCLQHSSWHENAAVRNVWDGIRSRLWFSTDNRTRTVERQPLSATLALVMLANHGIECSHQGNHSSPDQTNRFQHRQIVPFRIHPHPGNHQLQHTSHLFVSALFFVLVPWRPISWIWPTWRWWCRDCCLKVRGFSLVVRLRSRLPIGSLALVALHGIHVLTLGGIVEFSNVHRLSSIVRLLTSQLLSHIRTHPQLRCSLTNRSGMSLGSMALIAAVFTLSGTTSVNLTRAPPVLTPTAWPRLKARSRSSAWAIWLGAHWWRFLCNWLGLNHCVTACQQCRLFPGSALKTRRTKVATSPPVRDRSSSHGCAQLSVPTRCVWCCYRVAPKLVQLADFSQKCTTLPVMWQYRCVLLHPVRLYPNRKVSKVGSASAEFLGRCMFATLLWQLLWLAWQCPEGVALRLDLTSVAKRTSSAWACSVGGWFIAKGNTPHWAKAQQVFPLALSTWKKGCRSECR